MNTRDIYTLLRNAGIPVAHNVFLKKQVPPYILYRYDGTDIIVANSRAVLKKQRIAVELYSKPEGLRQAEAAVENVLDNFTTYSKERSFDDEQQIYVTYYKFYIF